MELLANWSLNSDPECLDQVCISAGLPPGCGLVELGCTEWTGLGYALFWVAGIVDIVVYILGVIAIAIVVYRRKRASPSPPSDPQSNKEAA
jgi:hypothetical protein